MLLMLLGNEIILVEVLLVLLVPVLRQNRVLVLMVILPRLLLLSARGLRVLLGVWLQALIALLYRPEGGTSLMVSLLLKLQGLLNLVLLLGPTD